MINISQSQVISHKQASALLSVMLILTIVIYLCILDSIGAEMKKLSNRLVISTVLIEGDPVRAAQGVDAVRKNFNGEFTVGIGGGFCINTKDFPTSLVLALKLIFVLNGRYSSP